MGESCGGGNEGKENGEKIGGGVYISLQTTTTSTTGTDETQSLVPTYDPHDEEEFFNTSFICMCLIRSPLDPAGLMASGVSSLKAHSCCQT